MEETNTNPVEPVVISKKQAVKNWMQFEMAEELADSLVANKFLQPTEV